MTSCRYVTDAVLSLLFGFSRRPVMSSASPFGGKATFSFVVAAIFVAVL